MGEMSVTNNFGDNMTDRQAGTTHFGFSTVPETEKAGKVAEVFTSVASKYDLMNDIMSLGTHRILKHLAVEATRAREGQKVLDLAGGTGDLTLSLADRVGVSGQVILADINRSMLDIGRDRLINAGKFNNVAWTQADAEQLPFAEASFDAVIMGFGLRNVTHIEAALASVLAVLKPAGRLVVLEFSQPADPITRQLHKGWTSCWPKLGKLVTGDEASYQYLIESIHMHPDQQALANIMTRLGFEQVSWQNYFRGLVAIHEGRKP